MVDFAKIDGTVVDGRDRSTSAEVSFKKKLKKLLRQAAAQKKELVFGTVQIDGKAYRVAQFWEQPFYGPDELRGNATYQDFDEKIATKIPITWDYPAEKLFVELAGDTHNQKETLKALGGKYLPNFWYAPVTNIDEILSKTENITVKDWGYYRFP